MKIVLVELRNGEELSELSFAGELVKIGRDKETCEIAFDQANFPMVSRRHAELRWNRGQWFLIDSNSSYGTFLDEKQISQPTPLKIGNKIQIGTDGPIFKVIWFQIINETPQSQADISFAETAVDIPIILPQIPQNIQPIIEPKIIKENKQAPLNQQVTELPKKLLLKFNNGKFPPFELIKDSIWIGRNPDCDIVFDAAYGMVSRQHAKIIRQNNEYFVHDNKSFNGIFVNGNRILGDTKLSINDEVQIGVGGPIIKLVLPFETAEKVLVNEVVNVKESEISPKTMVIANSEISQKESAKLEIGQSQLLFQKTFDGKTELTIGRAEGNDIILEGLQISNKHARLIQNNSGISIEDLSSSNGTYLNAKRVTREQIMPNDAVQIGSYQIKISQSGKVGVFDVRSKTRIDLVNISKEVKNRSVGGKLRLLDDVSLSIQPNEFIGLLGSSGAGKSTLMDAMNGMRPASNGSVLINNIDLYTHLDLLKQSIGYVPQDDIIHRELSVYRTLFYVAKLRLSRDISSTEIKQIIDEVLDVTGLSERRNVPINQLSGGQRKRVSIAVELITKPSVIFLDEPTSGLDPATEEKIMKLFRQIAESGRTVILTTHAMENVKLFDKIVVLMRGKLVFYGKPDEALKHLGASNFKDLFDKLEAPIEQVVQKSSETNRPQITEQIAEDWKQKFLKTPQYQQNIFEPLKQIAKQESGKPKKKNRLGIFGSIRQTITLSRRYLEVLFRDKFNLFILLAQAPIIALLTFLVVDNNQPRDFLYFVLAIVSIWFGTSVSAREIIREQAVYNRERMVNLGLFPYLTSKIFVLGIIVGLQCLMLFVPLKLFDLIGLMPMPGEFLGVPQFWAMLLTASVGLSIGLLISALVKTSEMATSLIPLILIPQILFSGLVSVPNGISKVVGLTMPATWSFDTMKRFSTLDTLQTEGADERSDGVGLYKFTERKNDKIIADAKNDIDNYKKQAEDKISLAMRNGQTPTLENPPKPKDVIKLSENLSEHINFLHPWMHEVLNQLVLMIMFLTLCLLTLIVLRFKDIS